MKLHLKQYEVVREVLKKRLAKSNNHEETIAYLAIEMSCPLLVLYIMYKEMEGSSPEIEKKILNLTAFYGVTEVINE